MKKEVELTRVSSKGQIVIPKSVRENLGIKPKTTLLVYSKGDTLILKKYQQPAAKKWLEELFKTIDRRTKKFGRITKKEIAEEIRLYREAKLKASKLMGR
jgi:AbrB family looped-hinge helix DNA binding protein